MALALMLIPVGAWGIFALGDTPLSGVRVAGIALPDDRPVGRFIEEKARDWADEKVVIEAGYYRWTMSREELGTTRPIGDVVDRVMSLGRSANPISNLSDMLASRRGRLEVPWRAKVDAARLQTVVDRIREQVERLPVAGTVGIDGTKIEGQHGERLDGVSARARLKAGLRQGRRSIRLQTHVTSPPPPQEYDRTATSATRLFTAQETFYALQSSGRRTNIELAAKFLDGQKMMPGATLSFNEIVGERSAERGFGPAKELRNREVVDGIGGGVCQTAATLHGAAFNGGLAIPEHRPHSRLNRFRYIDLGLDAMVSWPNKDLKIRNTYPFPIVIKTQYGPRKLPDGGTRGVLRVELWGAGKPYHVEVEVTEGAPIPPGERHRDEPELPLGITRVAQDPQPGVVLTRTRTIVTPVGRTPEVTQLRYPPVDRIILVGTAG
ncbi:MAG: VanW family protein [Myxococcales bacterium]|nr:VanW family protein [Myxococcales bacterium]